MLSLMFWQLLPTGGTETKPIGMVCVGFATKYDVTSATKLFQGDRSAVREQSVNFVLATLARATIQSL